MVNIAILTSEITLSEAIIQYFKNSNINISCIISNNSKSKIDNKFRRYKIKTFFTNKYKEIDQILTETNTHYIILADYNEDTPKNFTNKYKWKMINIKQVNDEIIIFYVKNNFSTEDIIFKIKNNDINKFYPIIIEKIINKTYSNIFK
jgi:formyltetrahydrofolate hydrolase